MMDKEQQLLDSALNLFTEFGFHATPTSKIAKDAGVSNGTLFHYFPTKEVLILKLYEEIKKQLNVHLEKSIPVDAPLKQTFKVYFKKSIIWALENQKEFDYIQQFINSPFITMVDISDTAVTGNHHKLIEQGQEKGELVNLPSQLILALISNTVIAVYSFLKGNNQNQKEILQKSFKQFWKLIT
ncbi:TetR/AcrR family transcriptional regulator [Aquimarina sp. U1-2]|uniref:TetR/AcrR family transcriptional regulator n=1 Tax=Aquimarina sp. U1-2 TaxID=2823141 RepID=UPI001AEC90ED|nr:TetR/AcrR family transcriptional regulator [Aquimarina sp. U1-2]MBP2833112.1 TetR/AcrR family transcriptional regulator [Aquimarina sp. U1-2]